MYTLNDYNFLFISYLLCCRHTYNVQRAQRNGICGTLHRSYTDRIEIHGENVFAQSFFSNQIHTTHVVSSYSSHSIWLNMDLKFVISHQNLISLPSRFTEQAFFFLSFIQSTPALIRLLLPPPSPLPFRILLFIRTMCCVCHASNPYLVRSHEIFFPSICL